MKVKLTLLVLWLTLASAAYAANQTQGSLDTAKLVIAAFKKFESGQVRFEPTENPENKIGLLDLCQFASKDLNEVDKGLLPGCAVAYIGLARDTINVFNAREASGVVKGSIDSRVDAALLEVLTAEDVACAECMTREQRLNQITPQLNSCNFSGPFKVSETLGIFKLNDPADRLVCGTEEMRLEINLISKVVKVNGIQEWGPSGSLGGKTLKGNQTPRSKVTRLNK